ncbi:amino acid permease/ SLC12A domain-containing protein [Aspergillus unguis]
MALSTPTSYESSKSNTHTDESEKHIDPEQLDPSAVGDHGADTDLQRQLSTRHLTMIALGSSIGMGLWLGSGISLHNGGPAAILIGYCLAGTMVWSVSQAIGEMAVLYPLPSAFVQWAGIFVDPSLGFAVGWAYWFSAFMGVANELQGIVTILNYWTDAVPAVAWITVFWVVIIFINAWAVRFFGEVEMVAAAIKFGWIFVVIISLIVVSAGGAPNHETTGFHYWNTVPFTNGFKGFLSVMPTCIFAMAGSENSGVVAAETQNPRKSVPKAISSVWLRLSLFYILGSFVVTITVDPNNPDLFGGSGGSTSPFVIAYQAAGLPALAHMTNAVIFISIVSAGGISGFAGARMLMGLSHLNLAPKIFGRADSQGRPLAGLAVTILGGGALAYMNVSASGSDVFEWLSNLTSLFTLFGWGSICLSHLRMRYAWKVQGRAETDLPWRTWTYPYSSIWALSWCILLIIAEFCLSVWPLNKEPNARDFFANYISVIVIVVVYLGARFWYRGPWWVDAEKIDLDASRRFYADESSGREGSVVTKVVERVLK